MKRYLLLSLFTLLEMAVFSQDPASVVIQKLKQKNDTVRDYEAKASMKTNVSFIKAPLADILIFYKSPDKVRIKNETGISFIPKGAVNISMGNIFTIEKYTAIDAGKEKIGEVNARVIKIIPDDENADVILATLYVDESRLLVLRSKTTTRQNGTYQLDMAYGRYSRYGLPDRLVFTFNTKDFKLPKGVTFDYDTGTEKKSTSVSEKGMIEISCSSYTVNRGLSDEVFK